MTKYIICLGDGMADEPIASLGNKTPLQAAKTPHMDQLAKEGQCGLVHTVPDGLHPGSDVANMGILGYDPRQYHTGRGPIEAASMGLTIPENKSIFRCNLVHIDQNIMKDFTSGHISSEESDTLLTDLHHALKNKIEFFTGVGYRHIALLDDRFNDLKTNAPHDITNQNIDPYLPKGPFENEIRELIKQSQNILETHPINKTRIEKNLAPATSIWPWSQGKMPILPSFKETYGLSGGIVTAVDLLKGLGTLTQLETPNVEGATGFLDTNYEAKVAAGLDILTRHDFLYLHIEAPDEAGHMGDVTLKTKAIEDFDKNIVGPIRTYQQKNPDTAIMVLPDHPTPCHLQTHTNDPVPFIISHPKFTPDSTSTYSESTAATTNQRFNTPWELLSYFLRTTKL